MADAPSFCHTASLHVRSGTCTDYSKPLKHSDGFKYDHGHNTGESKSCRYWSIHGLKYKLGLKCGENIQK